MQISESKKWEGKGGSVSRRLGLEAEGRGYIY